MPCENEPECVTYAETKDKPITNWREILTRACERGVSDREAALLTERSQSWVTCACGNLCSIIPRASRGEPRDNQLAALGTAFYDAIRYQHFHEAAEVLEEIEIRSIELIRRIREMGLYQPSIVLSSTILL